MSQIVPSMDVQRRKKFIPNSEKYMNRGSVKILERNMKGYQSKRDLESTFNPDQIPPSFEKAQIHQQATLVGPENNALFNDENGMMQLTPDKFCKCCARKTERIRLKLNCNLKELSYIGSGYPLYFRYLQFCGLIILAILFISGLFNMITNFLEGDICVDENKIIDENKQCQKNWITIFSIGNKINKEDLIRYQDYLDLATIAAIIIMLQFFRRHIQHMEVECDILDLSAYDYTILVKNIPKSFQAYNNDYDEDLQQFLEEQLFEKYPKFRIANINLTYKMDGLHHFFQLKEDLLKEKAKIVWYQHKQGFYQPGKTIAMINCELKDIQQEIDLNLNKFYDGKETAFMEKYFSGQAFVSFSDPEAKQQVLEKYQKKSFFQKRPKISYHNQNIEIHDAPDPLDVYWDNLHINNQFIRIIISYFVILIVVGSAFASIYFYTDNIGKIIDIYKESQIFRFAVTFVISVIINIFNMGILILGKKLSQFERLHTKTEYNISAMRKITLGQAIITVSIIYIIDIILHQKNSNSFGQTFKQGGLAYTATVVIIGNTAIPFLIEFFDLKSLFRRYKQWRVRRKAQYDIPILKTQQKLNKLYENIDFDIIYRYSVAIKTMYVCAFYTSIIPMALVWGLLSLILTFWIDKYNLLRRRSVLSNMSSNLAHQMVGILEFCLVLFALGNFATHVYQIQDTDKSNFYKSFSIFGVYAAVAHMLLPTKVIAKKLFPSPENPPNEDTYELSKLQFVTDYQRENPATGEASRQQHMKRIMEIKKKQDERSNVHHLTLGSIQSIEKIQKIQEMYNMKLSKKPNQRQENQSERVLLKTQESDLEDQNIQQVSSKEPSRVNLEQY